MRAIQPGKGEHLREGLQAEHLLGFGRDKYCMLPVRVRDLLSMADIEDCASSGPHCQDHKPSSPRSWIPPRFKVDICAPVSRWGT